MRPPPEDKKPGTFSNADQSDSRWSNNCQATECHVATRVIQPETASSNAERLTGASENKASWSSCFFRPLDERWLTDVSKVERTRMTLCHHRVRELVDLRMPGPVPDSALRPLAPRSLRTLLRRSRFYFSLLSSISTLGAGTAFALRLTYLVTVCGRALAFATCSTARR